MEPLLEISAQSFCIPLFIASGRAGECLAHLQGLVDQNQFGFLPGREAVQVWFTIQAYLEASLVSDVDRCSWVTDLQKAFENIPREPIQSLALKLGITPRLSSCGIAS